MQSFVIYHILALHVQFSYNVQHLTELSNRFFSSSFVPLCLPPFISFSPSPSFTHSLHPTPFISLSSCPSLIPALLSLIYPFISFLSSPHCLHPSVPPLTVKLAKQIVHHSASFWFLIQCYLSTLVLYAGLYTLVYRFDVSEHPLHMMPTTNQCLTCSTM